MTSIRQMTLNDLPQVVELDGLAFNTARRTNRHLQACLDRLTVASLLLQFCRPVAIIIK